MKARDIRGTRSDKIVESRGRMLPKAIYVKWQWRDSADPWLETDEAMDRLAEKDQDDFIGEYRLVKVRKVNLALQARETNADDGENPSGA